MRTAPAGMHHDLMCPKACTKLLHWLVLACCDTSSQHHQLCLLSLAILLEHGYEYCLLLAMLFDVCIVTCYKPACDSTPPPANLQRTSAVGVAAH